MNKTIARTILLAVLALFAASCASPPPAQPAQKPLSGPVSYAPANCFAYFEADRPDSVVSAVDSYAKALFDAVAKATGQELPRGAFDGHDSFRELLDATMREALPEGGLATFDLSKPAAVYVFRRATSPAMAFALPVKDEAAFQAVASVLASGAMRAEHIEGRDGYILFAKELNDKKLHAGAIGYGDGARALAKRLPEAAPGAIRYAIDARELLASAGEIFSEIEKGMDSLESMEILRPLLERMIGYARDASVVSGTLMMDEGGIRLGMKADFAEGSEAWAALARAERGRPEAAKALAARLPADAPIAMVGANSASAIDFAFEFTGLILEAAMGSRSDMDNESIHFIDSLRRTISLAKEAYSGFPGPMAFAMMKGMDLGALISQSSSPALKESMLLASMLGMVPQGQAAVYSALGLGGEGVAYYECPDPAKAAEGLERFIASDGLKAALEFIGREIGGIYDFRIERSTAEGSILHRVFATMGGVQGEEALLYSAAYGKGIMCSASGEGSDKAALEGLSRASGGFIGSASGKSLVALIDAGYENVGLVDLSRFFGGAASDPVLFASDWGEGFVAARFDISIKGLVDYIGVVAEQLMLNQPRPVYEDDDPFSLDGYPSMPEQGGDVESGLLGLMLEVSVYYGHAYVDELNALSAAAVEGNAEGFMAQLDLFVERASEPYEGLRQVLDRMSGSYDAAYALYPGQAEELDELLMETVLLEDIIESLDGILGDDDLLRALEALEVFREW
jgi:hypothetical protein